VGEASDIGADMTPRFPQLLLAAVFIFAGALAAQNVGSVLINEVCADSGKNLGTTPTSGSDLEWVELYNTTSSQIDLSNWQVKDNSGLVVLPTGSSIPANGYFVFTLIGTAAQFTAYTGWVADYINTQGWTGLANGGDGLAIFTSTSVCIDYMQYGSGNAVPGAPTWSGTRPSTVSGSANDFSYSRIPNGVDGDASVGDAGSEQAGTSFSVAPFTPGRANGLPVVDVFVPDEYSLYYSGSGTPFQTLCMRDANDPFRVHLNVPPGFDLDANSSHGSPNAIAILARYHDTAATVSVAFTINGSETTVSTPNLTLPSGGNMSVPDSLLQLVDVVTGQFPNTTGTVVVDISCAVSGGATTVYKLEVTLDAPVISTNPNLDDILEAQTSQVTLAATGGATPYTWSLANEPAWVAINSTSGQLTMSPGSSTAGNYTFDVTVDDNNTPARSDTVTFNVDVVAPLTITTGGTLNPISEGGSPVQTISATGGTTPYTWSLSGAPGWLSINSGTGALQGTAPSGSANTYNFSIDVVDNGNPQQSDSLSATLEVVNSLTISSPAAITNGSEASPYSYTFAAVGGTPNYVWSATGLPSFLGLNPNTGELAGTPTNTDAGTYNFDVTVTDSASTPQTDVKAITLVIDPLNSTGGGGGGSGGGGGCVAASDVPYAPAMILLFLLIALRMRRAKKE